MNIERINICDYGAVGDGITDDSKAIQAAIDACPHGGIVVIPCGVFACADIHMKPHVTLQGSTTWGYRDDTDISSLLTPSRDDAPALIDITNAVGCTLAGLSLFGQNRGQTMHGIQIAKSDGFGDQEDSIRIEECRISNFSGDALHLERVWCVTLRNNMLTSCQHGLYIKGWDVFIYDNWMTANRKCGIFGEDGYNTSIICQGNRIEWNGQEGILSNSGVTWILNGNHFDHNGSGGAHFINAKHINIVGNTFVRDGWLAEQSENSISLTVQESRGISIQSNVFRSLGGDEGQHHRHSPDYNIRIKNLKSSVIMGNVMYQAAVIQNIFDEGGHLETIIKDNVGSIAADDC